MEFTRTIKLAARALRRSPGLAILAIATLALGIGSTGFMFSVVYGALYRGLPFPDGDRVMNVWSTNPAEGWEQVSVEYADYLTFREDQTSFDDLAAGHSGTINVSTGDRAIRLDGAFLTANAFDLLKVRPQLGRAYLPGDDKPGAAPILILSHTTWQEEFGGDAGIVGRTLRVNGEPATVVGVMPEGFRFPNVQDAWVALRRSPAEERDSGTDLMVFGPLRAGVAPEAAQAELAAIAGRIAEDYPETNEGIGVNTVPFTDMGQETTAILLTMLVAVGLILLVACVNVANLLLARTATRTREIAMRTALGASRRRLIGQLIAEAGVLAAVGAALGATGAWLAIRWFRDAVAYTEPPFWFVWTIDTPILLFIVAVATIAAILSGVIPGIKATGGDVQHLLQDDSRGSTSIRMGRLSRALVVGEIALSLGLLVVAGLMARSIIERKHLDLAFPTETVFTARIGLFESEYPDAEARHVFYDGLLRDLQGDPAIEAAALTNSLPGTGSARDRVARQGESYAEEEDQPWIRTAWVSSGFFDVFETSPVRGRIIDDRDAPESMPVVVVNESFAGYVFEGADPVGAQIRLGAADDEESPWRTIVGVVPDMAMDGVFEQPDDLHRGVFLPLAQQDARFVSIAVRPRAADPMTITPNVRKAVQRRSPDTPLYWVRTLQETIDQELWAVDVFGSIMITFGLIALVMAVAGLYGVTAFTVGRRTHEMGIRMAMGAAGRDVLGLILRQGAIQIGLGLAIGVGLAALLATALQEILFRVEPLDPVVWAGITGLLTATALVASAIPAVRASRVDPARALRRD